MVSAQKKRFIKLAVLGLTDIGKKFKHDSFQLIIHRIKRNDRIQQTIPLRLKGGKMVISRIINFAEYNLIGLKYNSHIINMPVDASFQIVDFKRYSDFTRTFSIKLSFRFMIKEMYYKMKIMFHLTIAKASLMESIDGSELGKPNKNFVKDLLKYFYSNTAFKIPGNDITKLIKISKDYYNTMMIGLYIFDRMYDYQKLKNFPGVNNYIDIDISSLNIGAKREEFLINIVVLVDSGFLSDNSPTCAKIMDYAKCDLNGNIICKHPFHIEFPKCKKDELKAQICFNKGKLDLDRTGLSRCICDSKYTGKNCEIPKEEEKSQKKFLVDSNQNVIKMCKNGNILIKKNSVECECYSWEYFGKYCENSCSDHCSKNGCLLKRGDFSCFYNFNRPWKVKPLVNFLIVIFSIFVILLIIYILWRYEKIPYINEKINSFLQGINCPFSERQKYHDSDSNMFSQKSKFVKRKFSQLKQTIHKLRNNPIKIDATFSVDTRLNRKLSITENMNIE